MLAERLVRTNSDIEYMNQLLEIAMGRARQRAALVPDLETHDNNTRLVRILSMQQQHMHKRLSDLKTKLDRLNKIDNYLELVEGNPESITCKIKSISLLSGDSHDHDIFKMITYLVKQDTKHPCLSNHQLAILI